MKVWQMGSGSVGRDYSDFLVRHDIACLGPGRFERFDEDTYEQLVSKGELKTGAKSSVRMFCEEVEPGHLLLLRRGFRVVAIGRFHDDGYEWRSDFDDVRGWDLQHTRRVIWHDSVKDALEEVQRESPLFGNRLGKFSRVHDVRVLNRIDSLLKVQEDREPRPLPESPSPELNDQEIGQHLFAEGLSHRATDDVVDALARQRRLISWYHKSGGKSERPSEHEVVAHMVLPLLLALGWSQQLLAVEWRRIDLAGFSRAPTTKETCSLVCEAKGFGHGLDRALKQARNYIERLGLDNCRQILLSDGGRFYLFERMDGSWRDEPQHYLNILKPRLTTIDRTGGLDLILALRRS